MSLCKIGDNSYAIQCSFLVNSTANECMFALISDTQGVENFTGVVNRSNFEGIVVEIPNVAEFGRIFAFTDENGTTVGVLQSICHIEDCHNTGKEL